VRSPLSLVGEFQVVAEEDAAHHWDPEERVCRAFFAFIPPPPPPDRQRHASRGRASNGPSSPARGLVVVVVAIGALRNLRPMPVSLDTPNGRGGHNAILIFLVPFVNLDLKNNGGGATGERQILQWGGVRAGKSSSLLTSASLVSRNNRDRDAMAGHGGEKMMPPPPPQRDDNQDDPPMPTATGLDDVDGNKSPPQG
jgi:hypothetical protein